VPQEAFGSKEEKKDLKSDSKKSKNGVNPALFKSLYQDDKKILSRQVKEVEEGIGQSKAGLG
jgi:hypothetical protein